MSSHHNSALADQTLTRACVRPRYIISGKTRPAYQRESREAWYQHCVKEVICALMDVDVRVPEYLRTHGTFYVTSPIYTRMRDFAAEHGNVISAATLHDYADARACNLRGYSAEDVFLCADVCVVLTLLQYAMGFNGDEQFIYANSVNGLKVDWTSGATHLFLSDFIAKNVS